LSWRDGAEWEKSGLYKAGIVAKDGTYYMFYNAKNSNVWPWYEQIGVATSSDLLNWKRYEANPIIKVTKGAWDSNFVADPYVIRDDALWVMYYYGYNGKTLRKELLFQKICSTGKNIRSLLLRMERREKLMKFMLINLQ
jgi:predicted GH43/DUF377 family glycosyl hydrolase